MRDEFAKRCASVQGWPFLLSGVAPAAGQRLYTSVSAGPRGVNRATAAACSRGLCPGLQPVAKGLGLQPEAGCCLVRRGFVCGLQRDGLESPPAVVSCTRACVLWQWLQAPHTNGVPAMRPP